MFFDSEHNFSDFILQTEAVINAVNEKLSSTPLNPDDKAAITDLCKKVKDTIPYEFSEMKTQQVLTQHQTEFSEFYSNFKKLRKYLEIILGFTTDRVINTSIKLFLHWKKLAAEGNQEAKKIYDDMKKEFPDIAKQIEDTYSDLDNPK